MRAFRNGKARFRLAGERAESARLCVATPAEIIGTMSDEPEGGKPVIPYAQSARRQPLAEFPSAGEAELALMALAGRDVHGELRPIRGNGSDRDDATGPCLLLVDPREVGVAQRVLQLTPASKWLLEDPPSIDLPFEGDGSVRTVPGE